MARILVGLAIAAAASSVGILISMLIVKVLNG